jgi:hypothetical protein
LDRYRGHGAYKTLKVELQFDITFQKHVFNCKSEIRLETGKGFEKPQQRNCWHIKALIPVSQGSGRYNIESQSSGDSTQIEQ